MADALATAVFVLGPEKGYGLCQKFEGVDCLIVDKEGKVIFSPGLKSRISFNPFRWGFRVPVGYNLTRFAP